MRNKLLENTHVKAETNFIETTLYWNHGMAVLL